jgi:hypothetical protein
MLQNLPSLRRKSRAGKAYAAAVAGATTRLDKADTERAATSLIQA